MMGNRKTTQSANITVATAAAIETSITSGLGAKCNSQQNGVQHNNDNSGRM